LPERLDLITSETGEAAATFLHQRESEDGPFRFFGYDPGFLSEDGGRLSYHGRYRSVGTFPIIVYNRAMYLGLEDVQGYNPVQVERYVEFMRTMNGGAGQEYHETTVRAGGLDSPLLDLLNVRYAIVSVAPNLADGRDRWSVLRITGTWPAAYEDDHVRILENPGWLPRAWIVHDAREMPAAEATNLLAYDSGLARQTALVERLPESLALSPPTDPAADMVTIEVHEADEITVRAVTDAPGLLMLSEVYDPGWTARIDGEAVEILAANGLFRAIPIPAGDHSVTLRYEPDSLRGGLVISGTTAAAVVSLWLYYLVRALRNRVRRR